MAVEPMRHARLLRRRRPRGDDAQIAIDLHGIGIDDDAAELLRQRERQRRLAAGGRPCDKHRPLRAWFASQGLRPNMLQPLSSMTLVATLISNPAAPALDAATVERARGCCRRRKRRSGSPRRRRRHSLYRPLAKTQPRARRPRASGMHPRPIDVVVQPRPTGARSFFSPTWIPP